MFQERSNERYVKKGWVSVDPGFKNSFLPAIPVQGNSSLGSSGECHRTKAKSVSSQEELSVELSKFTNSPIQQSSYLETSDQMKYVEPFSLFQDLKRESASRRLKLLGLFIGSKYVTTAVSVDNQFEVASYLSFHPKDSSMDSLSHALHNLVLKHNVEGIVIGKSIYVALNQFVTGKKFNNEEEALQVESFVTQLSRTGKLGSMKYTYWNNYFANLLLKETWKNCSLPYYARLDEKKSIKYKTRESEKNAAVGVLLGYLRQMNRREQRLKDWDKKSFDTNC